MITPMRWVLCWILLAVGAVRAQDAKVSCATCDGRGVKDCGKHAKTFAELERLVRYCSVAIDCKACGGTRELDCSHCDHPAVQQGLAERRVEMRQWLDGRRSQIDRHVGDKPILHGQSAHVDLAFSIQPLTVGRERVDMHGLLHLYLDRIEALRGDFITMLQADDRAFSARLEIYMLERQADHAALAPRVAGGGGSAAGMKKMGTSAIYTMWHDKTTVPGDEDIHRAVVHNVTHLLLANMRPEAWLGNRKHGWVDEGVAHWFEDRLTGKCANYCYEEVGVSGNFKGGRWRVPIRKMAEANELEPFPAVSQCNTDQLSGKQHAQAFAYIDFLLSRHGGEKLAQMVRLLKEGSENRHALQQAFGLSMLDFDGEFVAWVKATYPLEQR